MAPTPMPLFVFVQDGFPLSYPSFLHPSQFVLPYLIQQVIPSFLASFDRQETFVAQTFCARINQIEKKALVLILLVLVFTHTIDQKTCIHSTVNVIRAFFSSCCRYWKLHHEYHQTCIIKHVLVNVLPFGSSTLFTIRPPPPPPPPPPFRK